MKNKFIVLMSFIININVFSQTGNVGINTDKPIRTLDINGNLRIRNIEEKKSNYILVVDNDGNVNKMLLSLSSLNKCPSLIRNESNPYNLKFVSDTSIPKPNEPILIKGLKFVSGGPWINNNNYYFIYSNSTGKPLDISNFEIDFNGLVCSY